MSVAAGWAAGGALVTGEAVELDLRVAQLPSRALSCTIDLTLQILVLVGAGSLVYASGLDAGTATTSALTVAVLVAVIVGYPATMETITRGKTLGKLAFGLRTVRTDGGAIRFRHSLARALVAVGEIWMTVGVPAIIVSMLSPQGRRIGDYVAGTLVIRERAPRGGSEPPPVVAPYLQAWVGHVDVARVPDGLALALRRFLTRAPSLDGHVRPGMALQLGIDLLPYLQPAPPAGSYPEDVIAAVVAERSRRERVRLGVTPPAPTYAERPAWGPPAPAPSATPPSPPAAPPADSGPPPAPPTTGGGFAPPG